MRSENLDALSDEDLSAIAERMGLALPPDLERLFVVEEILEALEDESPEEGRHGEPPLYFEDAKFWNREAPIPGAESLPRLQPRYNETMIKALVRDPSWAFALWDISETDRRSFEGSPEGFHLFLRVAETSAEDAGPGVFFDIPVTLDDLQWYINLPHPEARYRIDLAVRIGARTRMLARTGEIAVPRQSLAPAGIDDCAFRLLELSGLRELALEASDEEYPSRILRADA